MYKKLFTLFWLVLFIKVGAQQCDPYSFQGPGYFDTYHEYWNQQNKWTMYNVHDPTLNKEGEWYYLYNTDVAMGMTSPTGAHKRRSKNLLDWEFLGTAFNGIPQSARDFFLAYNPDYTDLGIWAPFLHKYGNEYRLYYSAPGGLVNQNLGFIGYATSSSASGPWQDRGMITSSVPGDAINAIDPTVITDSLNGKLWMAYGSYQLGIYMVELDTATGGLKNMYDRGIRVAARQGGRHAPIEGPELAYRNGWYYLFVSYDWLEDFYNVRVGRSRVPQGPYYDIMGADMADITDNTPLILAPYKFNHHVGWQGTGHCAIFNDNGQYFILHQGRPSSAIYNMDLHVRKIFWINDWPVVSPERYVDFPQCEIIADSIPGKWEHLLVTLNRSFQHATSEIIELGEDGSVNNNPANSWSLNKDTLLLNWNNGQYLDKLILFWAWDWENRCATMAYTGMNQAGLNIWGKKIRPLIIEKNTVLRHGATYRIRNHHSNKLIDSESGSAGANIRQWEDTGEPNQEWLLVESDGGYWRMAPMVNYEKVMNVVNENPNNGGDIRLGDYTSSPAQLWKIDYLNNGYFNILSRISSGQRGADVNSFSVLDGGNIMQWEFWGGNNQLWRFEQVQTGIDPVIGFENIPVSPKSSGVLIYPNPSRGEPISIVLNLTEDKVKIQLTIRNNLGQQVYVFQTDWQPVYTFNAGLDPGMYFLHISSGNYSTMQKFLVY